ncbi:YchJ family protein [Kytococcus sedentarius]|uniref:YchJ family protein n=1 Tax=Kytococcus sedentarius TaxID=1276 RepID=UPI0035BC23A2
MTSQPCPCGSPVFRDCCGPYLSAEALPPTAEALMRSRYSAFALADADHLWRTWHPRTRPASVSPGDVEWAGLEVLDVVDGQPGQDEGVVEFTAHFREPDGTSGSMRERSRFAVRAGRWFYVDGEQR